MCDSRPAASAAWIRAGQPARPAPVMPMSRAMLRSWPWVLPFRIRRWCRELVATHPSKGVPTCRFAAAADSSTDSGMTRSRIARRQNRACCFTGRPPRSAGRFPRMGSTGLPLQHQDLPDTALGAGMGSSGRTRGSSSDCASRRRPMSVSAPGGRTHRFLQQPDAVADGAVVRRIEGELFDIAWCSAAICRMTAARLVPRISDR